DQRRLVAAPGVLALEVSVEAVVRDVQLAADEPARVGRLPLEDLLPRREPGDVLARHTRPEALRRPRGFAPVRGDLATAPVRLLREGGVGLEAALLLQERRDVGHGSVLAGALRSRRGGPGDPGLIL